MRTRILVRPRLTNRWRYAAACVDYTPDWFDAGNEFNTVAVGICAVECPVRIECLRRALRDSDPDTDGVIRGGIIFDKEVYGDMVLCPSCRLGVRYKNEELCRICAMYMPCFGGCGRLVRRDGILTHCPTCKPGYDEELLDLELEVM